MRHRVDTAALWLRERAGIRAIPEAALVLGSGLDAVADAVLDAVEIPASQVPGWPASAVAGHAGTLRFGRIADRPVLALRGRVHAYEGHAPGDIVFPIRVAATLGARTLLLTNAAGGIRDGLAAGDLLLIRDHLNLLGFSPLEGENEASWGPRFPDMSAAYDPDLAARARQEASRLGIALAEGVYAAVRGPQYETPAEIRMLRALGADAVGMSTVPEVIAARHMGLRVAAVSMIANRAAGLSAGTISHEEVLRAGERAARTLAPLLVAVLGTS